MGQLETKQRYIADYKRDDETLFRCFVEFGAASEGWGAYIFDMRQTDANTGKPLRAYFDRVADPDEGKTNADRMLAWLLGRSNLPLQTLNWV
jgi:hypothetical protein